MISVVSLSHILFNGPLMIYIGIVRPQQSFFYWLLLFIGLVIVAIFVYKAITKQLYAFLIVHLVLFASLFVTIAYLRLSNQTVPYFLYNFLIAIGVAAIGYHSLKLLHLTN
jgi:hypothetical protein